MEIFKLFGSVLIDTKDAENSIGRTEKNAESLGSKLMGGIKTAGKWGLAIGAAATGAAVAIGGKALKSAVDFEKQMANVATLLDGDVKTKIGNLGEEVKKLSTTTGASTELLSDGLYQVISAFGETEDSMQILQTAAKGAAAGNATVTDSVNLLASVTKGYGDTSSEAANKASDLAFLTVKLGQTSFPELASSMGKVIPLASTMKVSQEELFGAMATLTGVTGNTAEVTTQLRGTVQGFMQPSKGMQAALKSLGYENGQVALESEGLGGMLDKLKESVGGNEIAFAGLFGSVEAKNAVLALTGAQADAFTEKTNAMKDAVGATDDAFKTQQATVSASWDRIKASSNVLFVTLGEKLLPTFQGMLDWVLDKMPVIQATMTKAFDTVGTVVNTVRDHILFFVDGIRGIGDPDSLKGGNKIGYMFFAIGERVGQVVEFFKENWPQIRETTNAVFESMKSAWETTLKPAFETIMRIMEIMWDLFKIAWPHIQTLMSVAFNTVQNLWNTVLQPVFAFIIDTVNKLVDEFQKHMPKIEALWASMTESIEWAYEKIINPVIGAIGAVLEWLFDRFNQFIFPLVALVIKWFVDMTAGMASKIEWARDKIDAAVKKITGFFDGIRRTKDNVLGFFDDLKNGIKDKIEWARDKVQGAVDRIKSMFDFKFTWPKLKMPTFSIEGSMNPLKWLTEGVPKLNVKWNAAGAIFDKPTIFSTPYGYQGVGEAGPEAVAPISKLMDYVTEAVNRAEGSEKDLTINMTVNVEQATDRDIRELMERLAFEAERAFKGKGGMSLAYD